MRSVERVSLGFIVGWALGSCVPGRGGQRILEVRVVSSHPKRP